MYILAPSDRPRRTWSERAAALRYLPPFIRLVYQSHPRYTLLIVLLRLLGALVPVGLMWVGKLIIEAVEHYSAMGASVDWSRIGVLVALEFAIALCGETVTRASSLLESLLSDVFTNKMSIRVMLHASSLDVVQFEDATTYDRLERAGSEAGARVGLLIKLLNTAQSTVTLASLVVALAAYVPWLLALLAVAVAPAFLGETYYAGLGYSLVVRWTPERRKLEYLRVLATSSAAVKEVKLLGLARYLVGRYETIAWDFFRAHKRLSTRRTIAAVALGAVGSVGYYGAYAAIIYLTVVGYRAPAGPFTIGVLTFLAASFRQSRALILQFLLAMAGLYEESLRIRDLLAFFELRPKLALSAGARKVPKPIRSGFVFENVSFRYPNSQGWTIRDLSVAINAGESVALVGENGAGKTTVVKLLARLYDPDEGRILLDGIDLRDYETDDLWRQMAVIFQDYVRYAFSFRENIGLGDVARIDDIARIRRAAQDGLAAGVAERLKNGFDQQLGRQFEDGVDLSGGEWQKVALARAYMREAQVLILDEPTASLDARAEYRVFRSVAELARGRITLIISHRFSTVRVADRILVLRRGRLVEEGSHEALMELGGLYEELFSLQAAAYR